MSAEINPQLLPNRLAHKAEAVLSNSPAFLKAMHAQSASQEIADNRHAAQRANGACGLASSIGGEQQ